MYVIVGDQKAKVLGMEFCSSRLVEMTKNLSTDELKQI